MTSGQKYEGRGTHARNLAQNGVNGQNLDQTGENTPTTEVTPLPADFIRGGCYGFQADLYVKSHSQQQGPTKVLLYALASYRSELYADLITATHSHDLIAAGGYLQDIQEIDSLTLQIEVEVIGLAERLGRELDALKGGVEVAQLVDNDQGENAGLIYKILGQA